MQEVSFSQVPELRTTTGRSEKGGMVRCQASNMKSIKEYRLKYLCTNCGFIYYSKETEPRCPACLKGLVMFWGKVDCED